MRGKASVEKLDVIAITESWINTSDRHFLPELEIEGYSLFHKDRAGRKGGGVALYIRDGVKCIINNSIKVDNDTESLWVEAMGSKGKLIIGVLYRPPNLSREDGEPLLREISRASRYSNVCIMGDFNFRNIDWDTMAGDRETQDFLDVIQDSFLKQLVNKPTREDKILDLILTNREDIVSNIEIGETLGNSDHREVRFNINWGERGSSNHSLVPDFRRADFEGLRNYLHSINELGLVSRQGLGDVGEAGSGENNRVEGRYNGWIKELQRGQKQFIPHREARSAGNYPRWMTDRLKSEIGMKRGLYVRIQRGETHLRNRYNELARVVKKIHV